MADAIPNDLEITDVWEFFWKGRQFTNWSEVVPHSPEANHGFRSGTSGAYEKPSPSGPGVMLSRVPTHRRTFVYRLEGAPGIDLTRADWADWAPDGSLLVGESGCLIRYPASRLGGLETSPLSAPTPPPRPASPPWPPAGAAASPPPDARRSR